MWELDYKESWVPKNWYFWAVVLEKTLESPLECKKIKPVNPEGHQSWIFTRRTDAKAEAPILWPPDVKDWLIRKDPDAGEDWRQEEKGMTEDETVGWHHWLNGCEYEQALGIGDGQGSLVCCSPWAHKESDTAEWLNWISILLSLIIDQKQGPYSCSLLLLLTLQSLGAQEKYIEWVKGFFFGGGDMFALWERMRRFFVIPFLWTDWSATDYPTHSYSAKIIVLRIQGSAMFFCIFLFSDLP